MVRMAVSEARFPLGPPAPRTFAWLSLSSVLLPLPFVWAPAVVFYGALAVTFMLAVGFAVAHRIRSRPRGWVIADHHELARIFSGRRSRDAVLIAARLERMRCATAKPTASTKAIAP